MIAGSDVGGSRRGVVIRGTGLALLHGRGRHVRLAENLFIPK